MRELAERLFAAPIEQAQAALNAKSKKLSGSPYATDDILRFLSVSLGAAKEARLLCDPLEADDLYEIVCELVYEDGRTDQMRSGVAYDAKNQVVYGMSGKGIMSIGYDYDIANQTMYSKPDVWQRAFGFTEAYDILGNNSGVMQFDTVRLKFPYGGQDWMIQLWKGRYIIANGGEVGVYIKPASRLVEFYDCAEKDNYLPISLLVTQGNQELVNRPMEPHWWMTGFRITDRYYAPSQLTLETSITLKDEAMLAAFCAALDGEADGLDYTVRGRTVTIVW